MTYVLEELPDHLDDEGPFDTSEEADRRQYWLEVTYEMGWRVAEFEGKYYCIPSLSACFTD